MEKFLQCKCGHKHFTVKNGNEFYDYFFICSNCSSTYFTKTDISELWEVE